jgi:hypothetical protein
MAMVEDRQKKSHRWTERKDGVLATFDVEMKALLNEAAQRRGISMAGYARRAIAAFIAHDLGMELSEVTKYCAKPIHFRPNGGAGRNEKLNDDGEGHGDWRIRKLM